MVVIHAFTGHVIHGTVIAFTETFAEVSAGFPSLDGWVFVHLVVIGIGVAMLTEIVPCGFNAFVIAALLRVAISLRSLVPAVAVPVAVLILGNS